MARRLKLRKKFSKKVFTRGAQRIHPKNAVNPMRGGIRI